MATYEYLCLKCDNKEERSMLMADSDKEQVCSKCGEVLKKVPSVYGFNI